MIVSNSQSTDQSREDYLNESLATKLSSVDSIFNNLSLGASATLSAAHAVSSQFPIGSHGRYLYDAFEPVPNHQNLIEKLDMFQSEEDRDSSGMGYGQKGLNLVSYIAGSFLDIGQLALATPLGRAGQIGGRLLGKGLSSVAPEIFNRFSKPFEKLVEQPLTVAGGMAGFSVAPAILNEYNPDMDSIHWGGVAKEVGINSGIGYLLPAVPYLLGILHRKVIRGTEADIAKMEVPHPRDFKETTIGKEEVARTEIESMGKTLPLPGEGTKKLDKIFQQMDERVKQGALTQEEAEWYKDYILKPEDIEILKTKAAKILGTKGHSVNAATKEVMVQIIKPEGLKQLQHAVADQLFSDVPAGMKNSLSDFVGLNEIDNLRNNLLHENPEALDGLQGFIHDMQMKLEKKPEQVEYEYKPLEETDDLTGKKFYHGTSTLENITDFDIERSTRGLYGPGLYLTDSTKLASAYALRKGKVLISQFKDKPNLINLEKTPSNKVWNILKNNVYYEKRFYRGLEEEEEFKKISLSNNERNKPTKDIISDFLSNMVIEGQTHYVDEIYEKLIPSLKNNGFDGFIHKGGQVIGGKGAHNVLVLFSHDAAKKLQHIGFEESNLYEKQEAIKNFLEHLTDIVRSNVSKFADPEMVRNYLKQRVESTVPEAKDAEALMAETKIPETKEAKMAEPETKVKEEGQQFKDNDEKVSRSSSKELKKEYENEKARYEQFSTAEEALSKFIACLQGGLRGED